MKPAGAKYVKACGFAGVRRADFAFGGHLVTPENFSACQGARRACQQYDSSSE